MYLHPEVNRFYDKKYIPEQKDPSEVWNYSTKNLTIKNSYFEEVESDLITRLSLIKEISVVHSP